MRRLALSATIILSLGLTGPTLAQQAGTGGVRYRWVDASGLPHYSDSLTMDALKYGYDVINSSGTVTEHVQKQLSPTERAAAEKQAAEAAARKHAVDQQKARDIQLLNTYPDEDALKDEQQQVLESLDAQMNTTRSNLHTQDSALTDLLNRAADEERQKKPVPKYLVDQITGQRNVVANERGLLEREKANREAMLQQQAQELQHFRDLKAAEKADRGY
ncbi:DUF4124 domain-containing protein [Dyella flagellata]|uniref:DUF4124 domain-containing protein n=1 Tax=Dyella flagellata TaxID=1867833 RepID=A0ABQ5XDZ8_9GAMM|nr:DUF4124 domain-containing protein [Dyella flagellata]GLQ89207.1 hypothetical protein GCM10007898_27790 [Dyella flagellata]